MPPFPEKESSLLAKLKKSKPHVEELVSQAAERKQRPTALMNQVSCFLPLMFSRKGFVCYCLDLPIYLPCFGYDGL